eukprot:SAG31_NODE_5331_length_2604_cov_1.514571_4_plen_117_part_00
MRASTQRSTHIRRQCWRRTLLVAGAAHNGLVSLVPCQRYGFTTISEMTSAPTLSAAVCGDKNLLPSSHYKSLVADGLIEPSDHQHFVLQQLDSLAAQLGQHQLAMDQYVEEHGART